MNPFTRFRSSRRLAVAAVAAAVALAACGGGSGDQREAAAGSTSGTGEPAAAIDATIAVLPSTLLSFPVHVAVEEGFFADHGLDVEILPVTNLPQAASALAGGSVDIAQSTADIVSNLAAQGTSLTVLPNGQYSDHFIAVKPGLRTANANAPYPAPLRDLKDGTVGVIARGGTAEQVFRIMLTEAGLDPDTDVTFVAVGPPNTAVPAFQAGQIDAFLAGTSTKALLTQAGADHYAIADATAGESGDLSTGFVAGTFVAGAGADPDLVSRYCAAISEAIAWSQDSANLARVTELVSDWTGLPAAVAEGAWQAVSPLVFSELTAEMWSAQSNFIPNPDDLPAFDAVAPAACG